MRERRRNRRCQIYRGEARGGKIDEMPEKRDERSGARRDTIHKREKRTNNEDKYSEKR